MRKQAVAVQRARKDFVARACLSRGSGSPVMVLSSMLDARGDNAVSGDALARAHGDRCRLAAASSTSTSTSSPSREQAGTVAASVSTKR